MNSLATVTPDELDKVVNEIKDEIISRFGGHTGQQLASMGFDVDSVTTWCQHKVYQFAIGGLALGEDPMVDAESAILFGLQIGIELGRRQGRGAGSH